MNMGKLGVLELQNRCYRELSGGQQQRVLLARAPCARRTACSFWTSRSWASTRRHAGSL